VNGVGGDGMEITNSLLNMLPSSDLFYGAACAHDVLYNLVADEFVTVVYPDGRQFTLWCKADVDDLFLMEMLELAATRPWWNRWFFRHAARRNYIFVNTFGEEFFKHGHI
jgi:hypothetical protein